MKRLIFALLLFLLAIWIGFLIHKDPGYVMVRYGGWEIETSLWVTIIALLLALLLVFLVFRIFYIASAVPHKISQWRNKVKTQQSMQSIEKGALDLIEENWNQAEKESSQACLHNPSILPLLGGAIAAHNQGNTVQSDYYFHQLYEKSAENTFSIDLLRAKLYIQNKNLEAALLILNNLHVKNSHHSTVLKLLAQMLINLDRWQALYELIPSLRKNHIFPDAELETLEVKCLVKIGENEKALNRIEKILKKKWISELLEWYSIIPFGDASKKLAFAEAQLAKHPDDWALYVCLGRLAFADKLLGKAKHYFESANQLNPQHFLYRELGNVYLALGDKDKALQLFRAH